LKLPLGAALEPGENGSLAIRAPVVRQHRLIKNGVGNGADERSQVEAAKPCFHGCVWIVYVCCSFTTKIKAKRREDLIATTQRETTSRKSCRPKIKAKRREDLITTTQRATNFQERFVVEVKTFAFVNERGQS
jgi:hypothetical protein